MTKTLRILPISLLLLCMLLSACRPPAGPTVAPTAPEPQHPAPLPTPEHTFSVLTWVSNPTPARDEQVIVYGALLMDDDLRLGGMMMNASWTARNTNHDPGIPNCSVLVTYGRGICVVEPADFTPGQPMTVDVSFDYKDQRYTSQITFTPQ